MILSVQQQPGQSIFDLALQTYTTLDEVVKLAVDNGVSELNRIPQQVSYLYDDTLVKFEGNTNTYATDINVIDKFYVTEDGGSVYTSEDGSAGYTFQ